MDIEKYFILLKVLENKSFSGAARELGYTQSAISHSVNVVEHSFGFRILNRGKCEVSLTEAGKELLPYIRRVVNTHELLGQKAKSFMRSDSGYLYVATIPSLAVNYLPKIWEAFSRQHPNVCIWMRHGNYTEVEKMLASGAFDCGFLAVTPRTPLKYDILFREQLYAVLPTNHPLTAKDKISLKDLEGEKFIMPGEGDNHQVGEMINKYNLKYDCKYNISDDDATVAMISAGMGVSILPEISFKGYLNFNFETRSFIEDVYRDIGLAYPERDGIMPVGETFISFVKEYFAKGYPPHVVNKKREVNHGQV